MPTTDQTPFLDARQNQLGLEVAAGDAIDAKALALLASDLAVLIFIAQSSLNPRTWQVIGLIIAFLISLTLTVVTIWPRAYAGASVSMYDHPEYLQYTTPRLTKQLIADTEAAIVKNKDINAFRWRLCGGSLVITSVASLFLGILLYFR
ncbi:MAG TPA: hypothetical protein VH144_00930 [Candidatus Saccharimonadales bacterium]|jgi:hypothetical protein|nr:hypothetical protein [Candidatus Saccharimonadales bacterium]